MVYVSGRWEIALRNSVCGVARLLAPPRSTPR